ncbi:MAG: hypothetical protein CVV07_06530 [Gammaproteobacteria bacterium HGW-Gammaproteobacteria-11]|nr:MAG: hypothetical protein CVV07_06530 [Gammaproteobacteria bacterium HGW-Gammaproteobacteria-11]
MKIVKSDFTPLKLHHMKRQCLYIICGKVGHLISQKVKLRLVQTVEPCTIQKGVVSAGVVSIIASICITNAGKGRS